MPVHFMIFHHMVMLPPISLGRSSTRRHAPPGGQSSFSVSWGNAEPDIVKIHGGEFALHFTTPVLYRVLLLLKAKW